MRIIAVSNIKGGIGKTTTAGNLACLAGTCVLRGEPGEQASAGQLVRDRPELSGLVASNAYVNPGLVPADFSERNIDLRILPFFSMVGRRRSLHAELIAEARSRLPAIAPNSPAAGVCAALWKEVEENSCRTPP